MRNAEPGWYDDGSGRHRWWDGSRWTADVADLSGPTVELDSVAVTSQAAPRPGWYDDAHGRMRWWDGREWTARSKLIGKPHSLAGITVSGEWIHWGFASQPVGGVVTTYRSTGEIVVDGVEARWEVPIPPKDQPRARDFVAWVNTVSRHHGARP
jgi:hypothetical protein